MRKERIKSIILVLLILNCLQLTGQIWFNKKLWPSGYNFFNSVSNIPVISQIVRNFPFAQDSAAMDALYTNAIRPQKIVISSGNAREVYYPSQKQYDDASKIVESVMTSLLENTSPRTTTISKDEWHTYLKGKSIYVDYGFNMDAASLANSFRQSFSLAFSNIGNISDIMITGDSVTKEGIVCLFDSATNTVTKFWVDYKGDELLKYIASTTLGRRQDKSFAFELNLDRASNGGNIKRKLLLSSLVLLPMENENINKISISNPLKTEGISFDMIVSALGYTPSSLRKSVTQEGVASYVENSATIRINPSGLVEYNAVEAKKGILLQSGIIEPFNIVSEITRIANEVWHATGEEQQLDIHLVSDLVESKDGIYIVKMNYCFMGTPVITKFNGSEPLENAIYAEVQDGYLKDFKMLLRSFKKLEETVPTMPVISAMDSLALRYSDSSESIQIEDIYKCYTSESGIDTVVWGVKISGDNNVVIVSSN